MEQITIDVAKQTYASAKEARRDGRIPMIYYGKNVEPIQFTVDYQTFRRAFKKAGRSAIITLQEGKDEYAALVHEVQYEPVTDDIHHVDLMAVDKNRAIHTEVPLVFTGNAPAVRELSGTFVSTKDHIAIECLPKDLPHEIEVDISSLVDFHSHITVGDIKTPAGVKVMDAAEINVASVSAPRAAEEDTPAEEAPAEGDAAKAEGSNADTEKKED